MQVVIITPIIAVMFKYYVLLYFETRMKIRYESILTKAGRINEKQK